MDFNSHKTQQLLDKMNLISSLGLSKEEIIKSFSKEELEIIQKSVTEFAGQERDFLIKAIEGDDIEKGGKGGKRAVVGEVREYSGRDYRKEADGSWTKLPKKEESKDKEEDNPPNKFEHRGEYAHGEARSFDEFNKVSPKPDHLLIDRTTNKIVAAYSSYNVPKYSEYTGPKNESNFEIISTSTAKNPAPYLKQKPIDFDDPKNWESRGGKKEESNKPKYHQVNYDSVREFSGKDLANEDINGVLDSLLEEVDILFTEMEVEADGSQEMFQDAVQEKVNELYGQVREGMWPKDMKKNKIRDILWGVVMDKSTGEKNKAVESDIDKSEDKKEAKVAKVMKEFKDGTLKTSSGDLVTDRDQAIAIAMSEAGINKSEDNDVEKGMKANIGDIHVWNGKKYKKQANGKWQEVSESHGLTKKEHKEKFSIDKVSNSSTKEEVQEKKKHYDIANELSDKEHTDEEVGLVNVRLGSLDGELTILKHGDKLVLTEDAKKDKNDSLGVIQRNKDDVFTFDSMAGGAIRVKGSDGDTHILSASRFNKYQK